MYILHIISIYIFIYIYINLSLKSFDIPTLFARNYDRISKISLRFSYDKCIYAHFPVKVHEIYGRTSAIWIN